MSSRKQRAQRYLPLLIAAAALLAYANSFSGPFIFDDNRVIVDDPHLEKLWPVTTKSRIVTLFTFRLNYAVSGMNYADYHAVNIAMHILAALLLYGVVRRTLRLPRLCARYGDHADMLALLTAMLWAVHPLQTESVTYICQRFEVIMGLFFLLSLYAFVRGAGEGSRPWLVASVAACGIGMGAKEIMVTLPVVVLFYDYVFLAEGGWADVKRRWKMHLCLFLTWGICAALMAWEIKTGQFHASGTVFHIPAHRYLFTQFGVITHYLRLAFLPHPLCLDYGWLPVESLAEIILPGLFIVSLGLFTARGLLRRRPAAFLGLWFFVVLAPTSSVMPIADMAFEHRMYLPLAAVMAMVVLGGYNLTVRGTGRASSKGARGLLVVVMVAVTGCFTWLTLRRNQDYRSERVMWRDVVEKREHNYRAAIALMSSYLDSGEFEEAEVLGRDLIKRMEAARSGDGSFHLKGRANTFIHSARNQLGRALLFRGDAQGAVSLFRKALEAKPDYGLAWHNISLAEAAAGRSEEALKSVNQALKLEPDYGGAHRLRGLLLARLGRYGEAVESYRRAIRLMPRETSAKLQLAWILATCEDDTIRDGDEAVTLARRVLTGTGEASRRTWDVLGAAYAEAGDFEAAISAAEQALDLEAPRHAGEIEARALRERLGLYRQGHAYREGNF